MWRGIISSCPNPRTGGPCTWGAGAVGRRPEPPRAPASGTRASRCGRAAAGGPARRGDWATGTEGSGGGGRAACRGQVHARSRDLPAIMEGRSSLSPVHESNGWAKLEEERIRDNSLGFQDRSVKYGMGQPQSWFTKSLPPCYRPKYPPTSIRLLLHPGDASSAQRPEVLRAGQH